MALFEETYKIKVYETNRYGQATVESIFNYLQEIAMGHASELGFGIDSMIRQGLTWVLSRLELHIDDYPLLGEVIKVKTFPSNIDRYYAYRDFVVYNDKGDVIAKANSSWLLIGLDTMLPSLIPDKFYEFVEQGASFLDINGIKKIKKPSMDNLIEKMEFHVRRSDLDINQHVNNAKFVSWVSETLPESIYKSKMVSKFTVEFRKSCQYKDEVLSMSFDDDNGLGYKYKHLIHKGDIIACVAESVLIDKQMRISGYLV